MEFKTPHCFLTEFAGLAPAEESGAGREERGGLSSAVDVAAEAAVYGCICAYRCVYGGCARRGGSADAN